MRATVASLVHRGIRIKPRTGTWRRRPRGKWKFRKERPVAKNISVFGIYPDRTTVSDAIDALQQARYRASDIAVLLPDNSGSKDFAHVKQTKAPEGAAAGVG